jgi:hypothetical protein
VRRGRQAVNVDLKRLAEVEARVAVADPGGRYYSIADLRWLAAELRAALAAVHDLQQESAAYRRGAEDMRERAARYFKNPTEWYAATTVAELVRKLPLIPEGRS